MMGMSSKVQEATTKGGQGSAQTSTLPEDFSEPSESGTPPSGILFLEPVFLISVFLLLPFTFCQQHSSPPCLAAPLREPAESLLLWLLWLNFMVNISGLWIWCSYNVDAAANTDGHPWVHFENSQMLNYGFLLLMFGQNTANKSSSKNPSDSGDV